MKSKEKSPAHKQPEELEYEPDYQLPADGGQDDDGDFEVLRDWYNDNLCLR